MKQKQHIGKVTSEVQMTVEAGTVSRFVDALGIEDPLSTDPDAAKAAGLPGLMLPHVAASTLGDTDGVIQLLEVRPKQVLHSREETTVFRPLCVGEELTVKTRIGELYEQQASGNPMGFVVIDIIGTDKKGAVAFESQRWLAIRGGFPRR